MFNKKKIIKSVDLLSDIKDEVEQVIVKKVKVEAEKQPEVQQDRYKATFTLHNENKQAAEQETLEYRVTRNEVTDTIRRIRSIHKVEDIKKPLPKLGAPQRMPANYKFACQFDYNPSLCKDYHDTGYCTFGDSCIYIHDRGDYKAGWEIEKEFQEEQKRKFMKQNDPLDEYQEQLQQFTVPDSCSICSSEFKAPVLTKCDHIFCEKCVLKLKKCPVCNKETQGIFTSANSYIKTLEQKRQQFIDNYKPKEVEKKVQQSEGDWLM